MQKTVCYIRSNKNGGMFKILSRPYFCIMFSMHAMARSVFFTPSNENVYILFMHDSLHYVFSHTIISGRAEK